MEDKTELRKSKINYAGKWCYFLQMRQLFEIKTTVKKKLRVLAGIKEV